MSELAPCPVCRGPMRFHRDDSDCPDGCHLPYCEGCQILIEFISEEGEQEASTLAELRALIAARWNGINTRQEPTP